MGFDPRRWKPAAGSRPITTNVEALLAENDALRREVRALRLQLELVLQGDRQPSPPRPRVTTAASFGITPELVERWGLAMGRHPQWQALRIGAPGGLRGLVEAQRRQGWNPALTLEQELDRRAPGLGTELGEALRGPHSRVRWAVRAAFAVYGPSALEWLSDEPLRVLEELLARVQQLEQRRKGSNTGRKATHSADPRQQALELLGLELGASPQAIKRAYRRLAKAHHPDLGGNAKAFHRLEAAYRLLVG
jgi:hypothetical protein